MRVRLIYNHIEHHAAHSGYDQLARHVNARPYEDGALYRLTKRIGSRRLAAMWSRRTPWYSTEAQRRELAICAQAALQPLGTLFHWFYAENDVRLCSQWRWRWNNRFVASFHQPPEFLEHHVEDKSYIRGLDAVVVMAQSQVDYMCRFLPRDRVFVVPHGVDTDYWRPDPRTARRDAPTFLFVGTWMRDLEMAAATIRLCAERGLPARFRMVVPEDRVRDLSSLPNTTVMTRIPDADLLHEYRSAHALFLPLTASTANNTALEAMSCGTGIVSTNVGGAPEYVTESCATLVDPGDVDAAARRLAQLCEAPTSAEAMGAAARENAMRFRWASVGALQDEVYRRIMAGRGPDAGAVGGSEQDDAPSR